MLQVPAAEAAAKLVDEVLQRIIHVTLMVRQDTNARIIRRNSTRQTNSVAITSGC